MAYFDSSQFGSMNLQAYQKLDQQQQNSFWRQIRDNDGDTTNDTVAGRKALTAGFQGLDEKGKIDFFKQVNGGVSTADGKTTMDFSSAVGALDAAIGTTDGTTPPVKKTEAPTSFADIEIKKELSFAENGVTGSNDATGSKDLARGLVASADNYQDNNRAVGRTQQEALLKQRDALEDDGTQTVKAKAGDTDVTVTSMGAGAATKAGEAGDATPAQQKVAATVDDGDLVQRTQVGEDASTATTTVFKFGGKGDKTFQGSIEIAADGTAVSYNARGEEIGGADAFDESHADYSEKLVDEVGGKKAKGVTFQAETGAMSAEEMNLGEEQLTALSRLGVTFEQGDDGKVALSADGLEALGLKKDGNEIVPSGDTSLLDKAESGELEPGTAKLVRQLHNVAQNKDENAWSTTTNTARETARAGDGTEARPEIEESRVIDQKSLEGDTLASVKKAAGDQQVTVGDKEMSLTEAVQQGHVLAIKPEGEDGEITFRMTEGVEKAEPKKTEGAEKPDGAEKPEVAEKKDPMGGFMDSIMEDMDNGNFMGAMMKMQMFSMMMNMMGGMQGGGMQQQFAMPQQQPPQQPSAWQRFAQGFAGGVNMYQQNQYQMQQPYNPWQFNGGGFYG